MIGVPTFYNLAFVSTDNVGEQDAEVLVQLAKKHRPSQEYMARIRHELPAKFPDVQTYFMPADVVTQVLNFGVSSMIDVQIEGRDPDAIYGIARTLAAQVRKVPGTEDVRITQVFDHPALRLDVDRQQAAAARTSPISRRREQRADVAQLVAALQPELLGQPAERRELRRRGADADRRRWPASTICWARR